MQKEKEAFSLIKGERWRVQPVVKLHEKDRGEDPIFFSDPDPQ